jgi:hypothetical protein
MEKCILYFYGSLFFQESLMIALALWAARLFVLFLIARMLLALFFKKGPTFSKKPKEEIKRFKSDKGKVVDADFKEL